jgi:hypothetical protein
MYNNLIKRKIASKFLYSKIDTLLIKLELNNKHLIKYINKVFG